MLDFGKHPTLIMCIAALPFLLQTNVSALATLIVVACCVSLFGFWLDCDSSVDDAMLRAIAGYCIMSTRGVSDNFTTGQPSPRAESIILMDWAILKANVIMDDAQWTIPKKKN